MSSQAPGGFGSGGTGGGTSSGAIDDPADKTTTTVVNAGGAGSQSFASFQPPAGEPNPFVDSGPWGKVTIGGLDLPGVIESIDGCGTPEEWSQQKGTSGNFATSTWKGAKLAEKIKIKMALYDARTFAGAYKVRSLLRPTRGVKPPSHAIVNPKINFGGITRIVVDDVGAPSWEKSGGHWIYEIELNEYNPAANATTGAADPTKDKDGVTPGSAQGAESKYVLGKCKNA